MYDPVIAFTQKFFPHVFPAFVSVCVPRPSSTYDALLFVSVIPDTSVMLPNTDAAVDVVNVGVFVTPVKSTLPIRPMSCVIVKDPAVIEFASKIAVSCGNGTRPGVAHPEAVNQRALFDQFLLVPVTAY